MIQFKDKIPAFLLGILTGLIIAVGFFIFKLDVYFERIKLYENITKTIYTYSKKQKDNSHEDLSTANKEIETPTSTEKLRSERKNTLASSSQEVSVKDNSTDSLYFNSTENDEDLEEVIIERDRLLEALPFQIINLNLLSASEKTADSLLQKVSGVKDDRNSERNLITVELWKSPLNYKGYKMSKTKLVVYGLQNIDGFKLYKLDGVVYAKLTSSTVYRLEQTYDYKPYQQVHDEAILNKLK
jgi:hypothetical protein